MDSLSAKHTTCYHKTKDKVLARADLKHLAETVLAKGGWFRFQAKGSSMNPFIQNSDMVILAPVERRILRLGDVIAFFQPLSNQLVIHRIVQRVQNNLLIKGDNLSSADGVLTPQSVIAVVIAVQKGGINRRAGLGPERIIIAFLSRYNLLIPAIRFVRSVYQHFPLLQKRSG